MNKDSGEELNKSLLSLGYPFNSILKNTDLSKADDFSFVWNKVANSFALFDKYANDTQLLTCSDASKIYKFVPSFLAALSSKNGLQAVTRLANYEQLVGPIVIGTFEEGIDLRIHISYLDNYRKNSRFSLLVDQLSLVSLLRTGTNLNIIPKAIGSKFDYGSQIIKYLQIKPRKSADNYLVFEKKDLLKGFVTTNEIIWNVMQPGLQKYIEKASVKPPFSVAVQNNLFHLIVSGRFQLTDLADSMKMSPRTIQRWLKKEGTNFKEQLNFVKKVLALNLLQDPDLSTAEISFLVGFNCVSSFYKSFKKWTGKTVLNYRHQIILNKNMKKAVSE
ncbi:helix-turn-helix transcriptional regulator [Lactobacillus sp. ESL0791]|uniref:helix-turn-helix transcriptional regulator n=1 Tax=Lactobacillus sp. ESL0791 TaxID=2983234 RepID=UPI0023F6D45E|nr:helix-turn-helix transcriptional regulator [Lactobacillus sp. ESL0791]MDF7638567.1 helix-turn-helix transcriptional regulator [Lactobacillus sp. ESL0791]